MIPRWFPVSEIPYAQMWPEAKLWWPYFFAERPFVGTIRFPQVYFLPFWFYVLLCVAEADIQIRDSAKNTFSQSFAIEDCKLEHVEILPEGTQLEK